MKIGDTIRRTSMWGDVVTRDIQSEKEIENYKQMQKEGFVLEVLVGDKWVEVPMVRIHKAPPESTCIACEG